MLVKEAKAFGNISNGNTKMPGTTFAIDALACKTGAKLTLIKGSVCSKCYAIRIQKMRPRVDQGYKANLAKYLSSDRQGWIAAIAFQIIRQNTDGHHRWFDAGDLQSLDMLEDIVSVCKITPDVKHWLPTREVKIVSDYLKATGAFPDNLVVRVSSPMIDGKPLIRYGNTSTVHTKGKPHHGVECEASKRGNNCGPCRACWQSDVVNVSYPKH
jgi:hypothetical protein